jgi:hypothetical protein
VKASRRKKLEEVALERLMANADDPYDYLSGEGADILGQWCPWSEHGELASTDDFNRRRRGVACADSRPYGKPLACSPFESPEKSGCHIRAPHIRKIFDFSIIWAIVLLWRPSEARRHLPQSFN